MDEYRKLTATTNRVATFVTLINHFKLKTMVEVGVLEGYFQHELLANTQLERAYGVDIKMSHGVKNGLLVENPIRYEFLEMDSLKAASLFLDESVDLVYLDGDHSYEYVRKELDAWWPKVTKGGILAGHDFLYFVHNTLGPYGVVQAVKEFVTLNNLQCYVNGCDSLNFEDFEKLALTRGQHLDRIQNGLTSEGVEVPNFWIRK